jgi:hypothetical protein
LLGGRLVAFCIMIPNLPYDVDRDVLSLRSRSAGKK